MGHLLSCSRPARVGQAPGASAGRSQTSAQRPRTQGGGLGRQEAGRVWPGEVGDIPGGGRWTRQRGQSVQGGGRGAWPCREGEEQGQGREVPGTQAAGAKGPEVLG